MDRAWSAPRQQRERIRARTSPRPGTPSLVSGPGPLQPAVAGLLTLQRSVGNRRVRAVLAAYQPTAGGATAASATRVQRRMWVEGGRNSVAVPVEARDVALRVRNKASLLPGGSRHVPNAYLNLGGYRLGKSVYVGGSVFGNAPAPDGSRLPVGDGPYREWDVHPIPAPVPPGFNRGQERIVTSNSGVCYYTDDHYRNFTRLRL